MILTCHDCPRQLCFRGTYRARLRVAAAFGWAVLNEQFLCTGCAEGEACAS